MAHSINTPASVDTIGGFEHSVSCFCDLKLKDLILKKKSIFEPDSEIFSDPSKESTISYDDFINS